MHQVISLVLSRRLVTLVGESGVGKTSVVSACCLYLTERCVFENGVLYMRLFDVTSYQQILCMLERQMQKECHKISYTSSSSADTMKSSSTLTSSSLLPKHVSAGESKGSLTTPSESQILSSPADGLSSFHSSSTSSSSMGQKRIEDEIYAQEEMIINGLSQARMLLVRSAKFLSFRFLSPLALF